MTIHDCPVFLTNGKAWASLPSKPQLDGGGRHKIGANGKPVYTAILAWRDKATPDRFSAAVVNLIRSAYPDALGGGP